MLQHSLGLGRETPNEEGGQVPTLKKKSVVVNAVGGPSIFFSFLFPTPFVTSSPTHHPRFSPSISSALLPEKSRGTSFFHASDSLPPGFPQPHHPDHSDSSPVITPLSTRQHVERQGPRGSSRGYVISPVTSAGFFGLFYRAGMVFRVAMTRKI